MILLVLLCVVRDRATTSVIIRDCVTTSVTLCVMDLAHTTTNNIVIIVAQFLSGSWRPASGLPAWQLEHHCGPN